MQSPIKNPSVTPASLPGRVFLSSWQRKLFQQGNPIYVYHGIETPPAGALDPFLYVRPEVFDAHLAQLREYGLIPGSLSRWERSAPAGEGGPQAIITFDDAVASVHENALPILDRHRFTGMIFIMTDYIGCAKGHPIQYGTRPERLMELSQIREWLAEGHEIGSHGATHCNLAGSSEAKAHQEIEGSKARLEDLLGREITHFCYPYGSYDARIRDLVVEAGYHTACTVEFGVNQPGADPFSLKRIDPIGAFDLAKKILHRLGRRLRD